MPVAVEKFVGRVASARVGLPFRRTGRSGATVKDVCRRPGAAWLGAPREARLPTILDKPVVSDAVSHMKISTRSLVREFPKAKTAAWKGQAVEVVDGRSGERFLLTAKPTKTFGEFAAG